MVSMKNVMVKSGARNGIIAIGVAIVAVAVFYFTRSSADPTAFCAGTKKMAVLSTGFQDNGSKTTGDQIASLMKHLTRIAPSLIKSDMKTEADAWIHAFKTGDTKQATSAAYTTANDKLNTWIVANCR